MKNILIRTGRDHKEMIREVFRLTVVVMILLLATLIAPIFQMSLFLIPAIYTALAFRTGILFPAISALAVTAMIGMIFPSAQLLNVIFVGAMMGIAVGESNYRKNDMWISITTGMVILLLNYALGIYLYELIEKKDFIDTTIEEARKVMEETSMKGAFNLNQEETRLMIRNMFPSFIIARSIVVSLLNYFIAGRFVNVKGQEKPPFRSFGEFALPGSPFAALIISLLGMFVLNTLGFTTEIVSMNLTLIYITILCIQGLAVVDYMLLRSRPFLIRMLAMLFCLFLYPALIFLGGLDALVNIRRLS